MPKFWLLIIALSLNWSWGGMKSDEKYIAFGSKFKGQMPVIVEFATSWWPWNKQHNFIDPKIKNNIVSGQLLSKKFIKIRVDVCLLAIREK